MANPAYQEQPVTEDVLAGIPAAQPSITFIAACETCPYFGPERSTTLAALRDYDRHALSAGHVVATLAATAAPDEGDDDA